MFGVYFACALCARVLRLCLSPSYVMFYSDPVRLSEPCGARAYYCLASYLDGLWSEAEGDWRGSLAPPKFFFLAACRSIFDRLMICLALAGSTFGEPVGRGGTMLYT